MIFYRVLFDEVLMMLKNKSKEKQKELINENKR